MVPQQNYAVRFSIPYETIVGESVAVIGSLEELGQWKEYKVHLQWTAGHVWQSIEPLLVTQPYFQYKYVLLQDGETIKRESGVRRVADLTVLPEQQPQIVEFVPTESNQLRKNVVLRDEWESYKVQFTLYDPLYDQEDEMYLEHDSGRQTVKMHRTVNPEPCLISKYGKPL